MNPKTIDEVYINLDMGNKIVRSSNIHFYEWIRYLKISNVLCVYELNYINTNNKYKKAIALAEIVSPNEVNYENIRMGNFLWMDYPAQKDFNELENIEIMDLINYISTYREEPKWFYENIYNRFACSMYDGSFYAEVHYAAIEEMYNGLLRMIQERAAQKTKKRKWKLVKTVLDNLLNWFEQGVVFDFSYYETRDDYICFPCWIVGKVRDHDDIWNALDKHKCEPNCVRELIFKAIK